MGLDRCLTGKGRTPQLLPCAESLVMAMKIIAVGVYTRLYGKYAILSLLFSQLST
jgi:hypothetical protein